MYWLYFCTQTKKREEEEICHFGLPDRKQSCNLRNRITIISCQIFSRVFADSWNAFTTALSFVKQPPEFFFFFKEFLVVIYHKMKCFLWDSNVSTYCGWDQCNRTANIIGLRLRHNEIHEHTKFYLKNLNCLTQAEGSSRSIIALGFSQKTSFSSILML